MKKIFISEWWLIYFYLSAIYLNARIWIRKNGICAVLRNYNIDVIRFFLYADIFFLIHVNEMVIFSAFSVNTHHFVMRWKVFLKFIVARFVVFVANRFYIIGRFVKKRNMFPNWQTVKLFVSAMGLRPYLFSSINQTSGSTCRLWLSYISEKIVLEGELVTAKHVIIY